MIVDDEDIDVVAFDGPSDAFLDMRLIEGLNLPGELGTRPW